MSICRMLLAVFAAILAANAAAFAEGFTKRAFPSFQDIQPRLVYGQAVYDVAFAGDGPNSKGESAKRFLENIVRNKFGGSKGNYIATLTVSLDGVPIVVEPILSANWENERFLFITTSEKASLVVNRDGVLLDNLVIDNPTNKVGLSFKVYYSKNSSVDLSFFKAISDLSKSAAIAAFVPGLPAVDTAIKPFQEILTRLLSNYKEVTIVENTVGAFTLLDEGFANELNYRDGRISVNIYLKTENSQLPRSFDVATAKFKSNISPSTVLATVASGAGAARATVIDIMSTDTNVTNEGLRNFLAALSKGEALQGGFTQHVRPHCNTLKQRLNRLVTTRDTALVYWAFLNNFGSEIRRYDDGKACGDSALSEDVIRHGLPLNPEWTQ